jgi:hypothetical protein
MLEKHCDGEHLRLSFLLNDIIVNGTYNNYQYDMLYGKFCTCIGLFDFIQALH